MRTALLLTLFVSLAAPATAGAATCSDYATQAEAQRAADTRDGDGDGIYCEALPCPCLRPGREAEAPAREPARAPANPTDPPGCLRTQRVQPISFSGTRYPTVREHARRAIARGWPRTLVLHRRRADARRERALDRLPPREGFDRDEYPPAIGRAGADASVAYVPSAENRSHGAALGAKLRRFCSGQRFRYVFF